jgi:hypothetical protein
LFLTVIHICVRIISCLELHETIRPTVRSKAQVNEPSTAHSSPWEQLSILLLLFSPFLTDHWPANGSVFFTYRKQKGCIEVELFFFLFPSKFIWREDELDRSVFFLPFPYFCLRKQIALQAFHFRRVG